MNNVPQPNSRTGARILVDQLVLNGVRDIFCVPGESFLAVLDALHDTPGTDIIVCRQEGGAGMMAEAQGKLTGRPGVCFVTRGPGAANAASAIHIAQQDSTPLIIFVGQVERGVRGRDALQELDYRAAFGAMAKWATEIDEPARIPEIVSRAFHVATSGRPGPVVIALPEDMLVETAAVPDGRPVAAIEAHPGPDQMQELHRLLGKAERPVAILGGSRWDAEAVRRMADFAQRFQLPVAVSLRRQMLFPADHPCFIGDLGFGANPKLVERVRSADLVIAIGGRLSEVPSQNYTLLDIPVPAQGFVHVHPDPGELGRVYRPTLAINAAPVQFTAGLAGLAAPEAPAWAGFTAAARADFLAWNDPTGLHSPGSLQMAEIIGFLRERLPPDAILCNGAGNYATWLHRFYRFRGYGTQLAPTSGSMGYGLPAGIGAKRLHPDRDVVVFAGDGCFMMHGQEFATAVQHDLPVVVILVDNGMYGTIRLHQERAYPGRVSGTGLKNPDFAALARAYGGFGERVERTEDFAPAFERALASGKPAILHLLLDPDALAPNVTLTALRAAAGTAV